LVAGSQIIRIEYLSGEFGFSRIDYLEFIRDETPAEIGNWGLVKRRY